VENIKVNFLNGWIKLSELRILYFECVKSIIIKEKKEFKCLNIILVRK
jgi:hypothetical protein